MRIFQVPPSPWEADHAAGVRAGEAYQAAHDDALPATPTWRMLERRYDLNPARFRHYHPNIAIMLDHAFNHDTAPPAPPCWVGRMRPGVVKQGCPRVAADRCGSPAATPEPASIVMGLAAVGAWLAAWAIIGDGRRKR